MKNRIWTDALREVKNTLGRFLSLMLLSALAVSFLAGLRTTAPDMERSADAYYDQQGFMDVHILSTLGLTDEDISVLGAQAGIEKAEGAYTIDAIVGGRDNDFIVKAISITGDGINLPRLTEGRMPEAANECLVEPLLLKNLGLSLGEAITLDTGTGTYEDALSRKTFTIVGTADSPLYISNERGSSSLGSGRVSAFLQLPKEVFTMDAYTDAYLLAEGASGLICYSDAYEDKMDALLDGLEPMGDERAALRYKEVVDEADKKLSDAQKEYDDAEVETRQKLSDAQNDLTDARKKLDDGWADYYDGWRTYNREIADAEQQIHDAEFTDLPDALKQLEDGEADYADGVQKLKDAWEDYENGLTDYQEGYDEITGKLATYNQSLDDLRDGETEYAAGFQEYGRGLDQLQDAGKQIQDNEKKLQDALDQLFEGGQALSAGQGAYDQNLAAFLAQKAQFDAAVTAAKDAAKMSALTNDQFLDALSQYPSPTPEIQYLLTVRRQLADGQSQLDAAGNQLSSAQNSLDWGYMEYYDGRDQLNAAKDTFYTSSKKLQDAGQTLADSRKKLDDGWDELRSGEKQMDDGWAELNDAKLTLNDAWDQLQNAQRELVDARSELDDGWADYRQGILDLQDAKQKLPEEKAKGLKKLRDALTELEDGESDYAQGLVDYEDGKLEADEKLSDARKELNDARRKINDIEHCKWYVLGRNTNVGYVSFQQDAQRMGNLASVFPLIFFLVAALVCLTTMTRMVEEHRVQIGGLKALGYNKWTISIKYVGYGLAASLIGGALGLGFGCTVIPWIIYTAWTILYTLGPLHIPFYPGISLLSVGAAVLTVAGAAFLTCWSTLSEVPASLMRPKAPKSGKRILIERIKPLWSRLTFTHKVIMRNLFRYQRRFWMTVIGIGGCTALIVTGFGLRDSIFSIMDQQYDKIYSYTSQIGLVDDVTFDETTEIDHALDGMPQVLSYLYCRQEILSIESPVRTVEGNLFTTTGERGFGDFIHLGHRLDDDVVTLPDDGAVLTEKLASLLGVKIGDEITLDGDKRVTVRVADITENYIMHFVYLSDSYYQKVFGAPPEGNLILARYTEDTQEVSDAVSSALIPLSGVTSVSRISDTRQTYQHSMESVDYAVVVVIVSAAALAFVVLFNLTNINITERMRELATLKVLGMTDRELAAYVFRENALLTVFGVLMGLLMGKFLHQWLVLTVEIDMLMFGRSAKPTSYLFAVLLTILFSVVVNLFASRKLKAIDMVESLKTVE
ncbi:MAG: FtsX-like permease family protein [Clostridia bacterium]|nr:FtsX-like permease family protein [Clostridia bacterium]